MAIKTKTATPSKKRLILPIVLGVIAIGAIGITTYVLTGNSLYELDPNAYVMGNSTSLTSYQKVTLSNNSISDSLSFIQASNIYPYAAAQEIWSHQPEARIIFTNIWDNGLYIGKAPDSSNRRIGAVSYTFFAPTSNEAIVKNAYMVPALITPSSIGISEDSSAVLKPTEEDTVVIQKRMARASVFLPYDKLDFNQCTKTGIKQAYSAIYKDPSSAEFAYQSTTTLLLAYPSKSNTYFVSQPVCFMFLDSRITTTASWNDIIDYRVDQKYSAAQTNGKQTGNIIVITLNHGMTAGSYNLENIYLTDNQDSSNYFDTTYCRTTTSGTLDKLHCSKKLGNKYWHPMQYTWTGTINGKTTTRTFTVFAFSQFVMTPFTFTYNVTTPTKSVLTGGMYQYRWWEDIAKYRSNAKNAWKWDQDFYDESAVFPVVTTPVVVPTWRVMIQ